MSLVESGLKVVPASVPYFLWSKDSQSVTCKISFWYNVYCSKRADCLYILPLPVSCVDWSNLIVMLTVVSLQTRIDIRIGLCIVEIYHQYYHQCHQWYHYNHSRHYKSYHYWHNYYQHNNCLFPCSSTITTTTTTLINFWLCVNLPYIPRVLCICAASYLDNKTSDWHQI